MSSICNTFYCTLCTITTKLIRDREHFRTHCELIFVSATDLFSNLTEYVPYRVSSFALLKVDISQTFLNPDAKNRIQMRTESTGTFTRYEFPMQLSSAKGRFSHRSRCTLDGIKKCIYSGRGILQFPDFRAGQSGLCPASP
jgi:hypothetical protein